MAFGAAFPPHSKYFFRGLGLVFCRETDYKKSNRTQILREHPFFCVLCFVCTAAGLVGPDVVVERVDQGEHRGITHHAHAGNVGRSVRQSVGRSSSRSVFCSLGLLVSFFFFLSSGGWVEIKA